MVSKDEEEEDEARTLVSPVSGKPSPRDATPLTGHWLIKLANGDGPAALPRSDKQRFSGQMHFRLKLGKKFGDFVQALKSNKERKKRRKS